MQGKRGKDKSGRRTPHKLEDRPNIRLPEPMKKYKLPLDEVHRKYGVPGENAEAPPMDLTIRTKILKPIYYEELKEELITGGLCEEDAEIAVREIKKIREEERKEKLCKS